MSCWGELKSYVDKILGFFVSPKADINFNSFGPFPEFFFQKSPKKWRKLKIYERIAKNERKFRFCIFWAISTCNTSKESIFHIEFNFTQEKYDLFEKKLKKITFLFLLASQSIHLAKTKCWPSSAIKVKWKLPIFKGFNEEVIYIYNITLIS